MINVHRNTSTYIDENEVIPSLGRYVAICGQYYVDIFPKRHRIYFQASPSITGAEVPIPMSETPVLIEPSFADAIAIIAAADELSEQTRRHWMTSLRQIAKALDKPPELIPARYSAVRAELAQLHHAPAGVTAKTLQNHKSNVKSALLWLAREKGVPEHGAPVAPAWEELRAKIRDGLVRARLSSLMRFSSANNIAPVGVDEAVVDRFIGYRSHAGMPADHAFRRLLARAWNANIGMIQGWPACRLAEPPVKTAVEVAWDEFPEGLRRDIERAPCAQARRGTTGHRRMVPYRGQRLLCGPPRGAARECSRRFSGPAPGTIQLA